MRTEVQMPIAVPYVAGAMIVDVKKGVMVAAMEEADHPVAAAAVASLAAAFA